MSGGLMQLTAYGAQDIFLTGNPQITFFKHVYRRHTNFSTEAVVQSFNGSIGVDESIVTSTISRSGDLIHNLWLDVTMAPQGIPTNAGTYCAWINHTGSALIKECSIEIGGQKIDRQTGKWLDIYNELTDHDEKEHVGLNKHNTKSAYLLHRGSLGANTALQLYIPLKFWFCRNPGLALPLIALQYHEIKLKMTTRPMTALICGNATGTGGVTATAPTSATLWADYIYLDTDERRRFAQVTHEYLIEQIQEDISDITGNKTLNFDHPVKELIWVIQDATVLGEATTANEAIQENPTLNIAGSDLTKKNDYFNYNAANTSNVEVIGNSDSYEPFDTAYLEFNGSDRFAARKATYFRICQPLQAGHKVPNKHIYCYSFALKPEEHQPSGTCNFSRLDNASLIFGSAVTAKISVYAINYNVLRIMSGMGGLAYNN